MNNMKGNKMINGKGVHPKLLSKNKITEEYILHSTVNSQAKAKLAVSLSNNEILYFDTINKAKTLSLKGHQKSITGIKFSRDTPSQLYSSSLDGTIFVWDLRSGVTPVKTFLDDSDGQVKPLLCFDFNADENFVCAGTELVREDSFIIFWDLRTSQNLGGYWNSHTDEITHVQFHSTCNSKLATSSVDGLINIFDLTESSEDDALVNTLNIETSVNRFCWNTEDSISCITGTEEFQFWSTEQTSPTLSVSRNDLAVEYKFIIGQRKSFSGFVSYQYDVDYLIDTFCVENSFYLASGSNKGSMHLYSKNEKGLKQMAVFEDGHTDVVRTISYCRTGSLITGGEDGQICIWKLSL